MGQAVRRAIKAPPGFARQEYVVNGVRTVVNVGGKGRPVDESAKARAAVREFLS
jgi:hypothetical protein